ncbi:class I SAM-dependent rRNA methyltransferase [bacterium]|nr:MAG: class I SAM-dependent rRNA methyltransferase [bacterium]
MNKVRLKEKKDKKIRNNYLWIFRDDVSTQFKDRDTIENGSIVEVYDSENKFLAIGTYNSQSHILVRILSKQNIAVDKSFFLHRIKKAVQFRDNQKINSDARRLIHAEADMLPGLMVDQFGDYLVMQIRSLGMEKFKKEIVEILVELVKPKGIYERSDMESRAEEGLDKCAGTVYGEVPASIEIFENDMKFLVDAIKGHKTGFYLDQRDNRDFVRSLIKPNQKALDLFSYTGAFTVALAKAGAIVTAIDLDPDVVGFAKENVQLNGVEKKCEFLTCDVFEFLDEQTELQKTEAGKVQKYDLIVIDPPAIAKRKEGMEKLKWAYWKLLLNSLKLLNTGGHIVLSSCAYHMSTDLMREAGRYASADLGVRLRVVHTSYQPPDHPHILQIPETLYLKTIFFQML